MLEHQREHGRKRRESWCRDARHVHDRRELRFKTVRIETAGQEVLGRLSNLIVAPGYCVADGSLTYSLQEIRAIGWMLRSGDSSW